MSPWWQEAGGTTYDQSHLLIVSKVIFCLLNILENALLSNYYKPNKNKWIKNYTLFN